MLIFISHTYTFPFSLFSLLDDFNMQLMNPVLKCFMDINGFVNVIKNKTSFKGQESSMDLILTNRKYSFKNSSLYKIDVSDHHHLMYPIFKLHYQNLKSRA